MSSKFWPLASGFPHDVSVGMASKVFPKFQPGFKAEKKDWAVTEVKVPVQLTAL